MNNLKLITVSGLPGSGKSTLAECIAKALKIPVFSVDPIESSILKSGIPRSFETGLAAYLVAETLAAEQLKLRSSVVLDAVSAVKEARQMWRDLAEKYGAQWVVIECVLEPVLHRQRIESRVRKIHGIPEVTWEDVERSRKEYLPWDQERLVLDSADAIEKNLEKARIFIDAFQ
ncbi:MAG: AAA family ATPase [candidate division FCPU426 bacterium]